MISVKMAPIKDNVANMSFQGGDNFGWSLTYGCSQIIKYSLSLSLGRSICWIIAPKQCSRGIPIPLIRKKQPY